MKLDELNAEAQKYLARVTKKQVVELTETDIEFLKARRDYLNEPQREYYGEVIDAKPEKEPEPDEPEKVPYQDLQQEAKKLGLPHGRIKRKVLERSIEEEKKKRNPFEPNNIPE